MIGISLNQILLHYKRTIIIGLMMSIAFFATIVSISTIEEQYSKYKGFGKTLEKDGYVAGIDTLELVSIREEKGFEKFFKQKSYGVESICYSLSDTISVGDDQNISVIGYGEMMSAYMPKLISGTRYDKVKAKPGEINAIISPNHLGIETGDLIKIKDSNNEDIGIRICGMMENKASYFNIRKYGTPLDIYDLYDTYDALDPYAMPMIIMSFDDLKNHLGGIESLSVFVTMSDNAGAKNKEKLEKYFSSRGITIQSYSDVRKRSLATLRSKLLMVVPVCVCVIVLVVVTFLCIYSLGVVDDLKMISVLYTSGGSMAKIITVKALDAVFESLLGLVILSLLGRWLTLSKYKNLIVFNVDLVTVSAVLVEFLLTIAIAGFITFAILIKNTPKDILNSSQL